MAKIKLHSKKAKDPGRRLMSINDLNEEFAMHMFQELFARQEMMNARDADQSGTFDKSLKREITISELQKMSNEINAVDCGKK